MKKSAWIIIDLKTKKALYGVNEITLAFSTEEIAEEVAKQFFTHPDRYLLIEVNNGC